MIKFGTSGWRGIIAADFTFQNVRLATQAIADYLISKEISDSAAARRKAVVILGHDTRFLGREFSLAAAEVLDRSGLKPLLCDRDAPTPVIAHTIRSRKAVGGINMTASHNPAEYQGLKFFLDSQRRTGLTRRHQAHRVKCRAAARPEMVLQRRGYRNVSMRND
jgi:phosphoglucomutase